MYYLYGICIIRGIYSYSLQLSGDTFDIFNNNFNNNAIFFLLRCNSFVNIIQYSIVVVVVKGYCIKTITIV